MVDFQHIVNSTFKYNFHCHTQYCDGKASMPQFVEAAVKAGYKHLGFTPHAPIAVDSPCNMSKESVPEYFGELERLRAKHAGKIKLYRGMEIDYLSHDFGPHISYFQQLGLDYSIGSVHFIPAITQPGLMVDVDGSPEGFAVKMGEYFDGDIEAVVRSFYSQELEMIEHGGFDVIGHFDKIGYNASCYSPGITAQAWYKRLVGTVIDAIMDHRLTVEINTKARDRAGRFFPEEAYFPLLKKYGATVVINSDTHVPALLEAGREEALELYCKS